VCLVLWDGKSAGVAVLFSLNFSGKVIRCLADSDSRVFSLLIDVNGFRLILLISIFLMSFLIVNFFLLSA